MTTEQTPPAEEDCKMLLKAPEKAGQWNFWAVSKTKNELTH